MSASGEAARFTLGFYGVLATVIGLPIWIFAGYPHALVMITLACVIMLAFLGLFRLVGGPD